MIISDAITTASNNPVAEILEALMTKHSLNQTELANRSGVSQPAINRILKERTRVKRPRRETLEKISSVLGVTPAQLTGEDPMPIRLFDRGAVPVIEWEDLTGTMPESIPVRSRQMVICPIAHGDLTFALAVVGEAMAGEDGYREGDIIFVDPSVASGHGKDIVVVNGETALFRRMVQTPEGRFLKTLNPAWPNPIQPLTIDALISGTVIFSGRFR